MERTKKRRRTPFSCLMCRKRKIKCDRRKPACSNCIKSNCSPKCLYEPTVWISGNETGAKSENSLNPVISSAPNSLVMSQEYFVPTITEFYGKKDYINTGTSREEALSEEISLLKESLRKLQKNTVVKKGATISFFNKVVDPLSTWKMKRKFRNVGVFSWLSLMKKDRIMSIVAARATKIGKTEQSKFYDERQQINSKLIRIFDGESARFFEKQVPDPIGLSGDIGSVKPVIQKISRTLPPMDIVDMLVNRFFTSIYPFLPIFDEIILKGTVAHIVRPVESDGTESDGPQVSLHYKNKKELVHVALVLLVLRLAYLTVEIKSKTTAKLTEEETQILNFPIGLSYITHSRSILDYCNYLRKPELETIQALLLLKSYYTWCPSETEGIADSESNILMAIIVQSAFDVGLNVNSNALFIHTDNESSLRVLQLWKKIWASIMNIEHRRAFTQGVSIRIDEKDYDALLPNFDSSLSNNSDIHVERCTIDHIWDRQKFNPMIRDLIDLSVNIKKDPLVSDIVDWCEKWEASVHKFNSRTSHRSQPLAKVDNTILQLEAATLLFVLLHHLLYHAQNANDPESYLVYLKKLFELVRKMYQLVVDFLTSLSDNPPDCFFLVLTAVERAVIGSLFFYRHVSLNLLFYLDLVNDAQYRTSIEALYEKANKNLQCLLTLISDLSRVSYTSFRFWGMSKFVSIVLSDPIERSHIYDQTDNISALIQFSKSLEVHFDDIAVWVERNAFDADYQPVFKTRDECKLATEQATLFSTKEQPPDLFTDFFNFEGQEDNFLWSTNA
ncbi:BA75_00685T0 [Komagataella pastoris]|uniref:BA75_00685T0 n=1 Tax=Komagataella pastoris TaxID=4922 RepID=A0A1B2J7V6_PICPA|nr:BA75_00685T0 [Komagataella pastoris]